MKTHTINSVADRASKFVEMAQDKAQDLTARGSETLHQADKEAQKVIKTNPYAAVGMAFGVGLALGLFLATARK
jgi:ElaB/YqjD/DUF883 family membrane-anchored ribosome-binding protein